MQRYFFHLRQGDVFEEDPEGVLLDSDEAALDEAVGAAREMVAEAVLNNVLIDGRRFEIWVHGRGLITSVPFHSVIRL
ncbi:DUF6894 family protein [Rhizobium sp. 0TCS1.26]|uniref:DUF6894 family protein n=1 Tax=Rhizobium sp. 0TCS1.26 TaxID=3142623 RepID=UPI003D2A1F31